ncbi:MAG: ribonuclease J [Nitrospirae bacterium]|nr:ribonuclease J [Nitrospirota bacterium]MBI3351412.1 ribonuclease J [Nitrospirota bacterium]
MEQPILNSAPPAELNGKKALSIIPLGGLGEIGMNMMVYEYDEDLIVVDAGIMFPDQEMLGIDVVIPDFSYLKANAAKIRGIVITHGHEDHIGALPYLLSVLSAPVYATPLTIGLISAKLKEKNLTGVELNPVKPRGIVTLGVFKIEFIRVTHSIVDGVALGIATPVGRVIHTGDFKIDQSPVDGERTDIQKLGEYGDLGTLALLSDSTNAERPGYTLSEKVVGKAFEEIFCLTKSRIIIATFSSNIHRIQQAVNAAVISGRKVFISGKSMVKNTQIASELGYLKIPADTWMKLDNLHNFPDDQIVLLTTGSQGEPLSSLFRMAIDEHKQFHIKEGDTVLLSSRVIPGNERAIGRIINHLFRRGAQVVYERVSDIHVSGHASQEELKMMINLVRPKFFMPIHGEYRQLLHHARIAESLEIKKENIVLMEDGDVVQLREDQWEKTAKVPTGRVFVDGKGVGDVADFVLRDRKHIGQDGIIVLMISLNKGTGDLVSGPEIISKGFVSEEEAYGLFAELKLMVSKMLEELNPEVKSEWIAVEGMVKKMAGKYIFKQMERRPMIIPIILEM